MNDMRSVRRSRGTMASPRQQGGAIIAFAAIGLSVLVILLSITDIGFLYYYKREYQKAADLAAMAGARKLVSPVTGLRSCVDNATPAAADNAARNLGGKTYTLQVECGKWTPTAATRAARLDTSVDEDQLDAVRATISGVPPRFLPFNSTPTISASAVALADQPLAQLTIKSTVAAVDTEQSALLNGVVGGLLGGSIDLSVAAWNGLLNTNINLLSYLDALALELGIDAGNYDEVLGAEVTLGQLLEVAADVLERGGGTGEISAGVGGLNDLLSVGLPGFDPLIHLGDLLNVQTGTPEAGLDTDLNLLQLVQGSVQLASSACAVCADIPINLPGVVGVQVHAKVIEPPQLSAIGNPALAVMDPMGPDRIYVRTAQVRTLISVDIPIAGLVLDGLNDLLSSSVVSGLTTAVNDLLSLNILPLIETLSCVVYCDIQRDASDIQILPTPRLDINLDAGSGEAHVSDYACDDEGKSLTAPTTTAVAELRIGKMGDSAEDAVNQVFASTAPPTVEPLPLVDIGSKRVRYQCTLLLFCWTEWRTEAGTWSGNEADAARIAFAGGGIGLKADVPIAGGNSTQVYNDPPAGGLPNIGEEPAWQSVSSTGIVSSLSSTLSGLSLEFYEPTGSGGIGGSGLGSVLYLVGSVVNTLVAAIMDIVDVLLAPLLDPLLDVLLSGLGIDLDKVDVGGNLSCDGGGATLVD
jgi:uncharacterized membrane protein